MTAKEYLKQYEYADRYAKRLRDEYIRENELIDAISLNADGMPHGFNISKPTEEKALRLSMAFQRWKAAEVEAIAKRQQIFEAIKTVPGIEGDVLIERYVKLKSGKRYASSCIIHGTECITLTGVRSGSLKRTL